MWTETPLFESNEATPPGDIDATKASAHLPGLDIEVVHRRSPAGDAEMISINLQAAPSFEAFGRYLEAANPFAFWAHAAQLMWLPWFEAARAMMPANLVPLLPDSSAHAASRPSNKTPSSE
jgi:hypothetical protein